MAAFIAQVVPREARERAPAPPSRRAVAASEPEPGADRAARAERRRRRDESACRCPSASTWCVVEGELSGLAALRRQLGEARAREALLDFLRVTEHVAYKHAAHPDRLDDRGFTYVLGLPVGTEDDAARAIAPGAGADRGARRHLARARPAAQAGHRRAARRGAGVARAGGADPTHAQVRVRAARPTAQIARRLAKEAMPGEVLVGGGVFRAARGEWRFEELDAIELPLDPDTSPGAARARRRARPTAPTARARVYRLLGRAPARRAAGRSSRRPRAGRARPRAGRAARGAPRGGRSSTQSRHVLILGEAGVGKRSIVDAFRRELDPATHLVLRAVGAARLCATRPTRWSPI